jgi:hypothetical protein
MNQPPSRPTLRKALIMSTPADNLNQWSPRRNELAALMQKFADQLAPDLPRASTLRALIAALRSFGTAQLDFFLKGFATSGRLTPSHHLYSPTYALDVTVNQIGYDLDLLLRASHQRTLWPDLLAGADQVAMAALQPAIQHDLTRPATVLTYLQKSPSIRLTPYAPVALVGLPFHATGRTQEIVTIVHEVGHYVAARRDPRPGASQPTWSQLTRNGSLLGLRRQLGAIAPARMADLWLDGWRDEIFADVYTCIVGGPKTGTTLLDLLRGLPATRWLDDDGEHPLPILRPAIYAATLRQMATIVGPDTDVACDLCRAAKELDTTANAWQMQLPDWVTFASRRGPRIDLGAARAFIAEEVKTLLQDDLKPLCPTNGAAGELWPLLEAAAVLATLDLGAAAPELIATEDQSHIGWADSAAPWQAGATGLGNIPWEQARDELLAHAPGDNKAAELAKEGWDPWWLGVLSAGAWTTEGPGPGNPMPGG